MTAPPPARAALRSMPRASAKAATARARARRASCAPCSSDTGLTIVGPNCMGVACGKSNFCSIPDETLQELAESPVAVVAQSGAICASINRAINELGLKVAYFASCGGQIGCKISDFIDYFAVQPELR